MRVKVGNKWHEPGLGKPIQIQLTNADRRNIGNMNPKCDRYASMEKDDYPDIEAMYVWMDEGYDPAWKK